VSKALIALELYPQRKILLENLRRNEGSGRLHPAVLETSEGVLERHRHVEVCHCETALYKCPSERLRD
jgi:hypothetical protein